MTAGLNPDGESVGGQENLPAAAGSGSEATITDTGAPAGDRPGSCPNPPTTVPRAAQRR